MDIIPAISTNQFQSIQSLAWQILPEHYETYIPSDHIQFFLEKFQTVQAIKKQCATGFLYYLILQNQKEIGYLGFEIFKDHINLSKLYILKEFRGKHIGSGVLTFVIQQAIEAKAEYIELTVNRLNSATIRFYEKHGFEITEAVVNSFENGHSIEDYKMIKVLSGKNNAVPL